MNGECRCPGDFVGVFEIGADGNAHRDPCDANTERLEQSREIQRRRLALNGWIGGQDHFIGATRTDTREESLDLQIVGPDAMQRREGAH